MSDSSERRPLFERLVHAGFVGLLGFVAVKFLGMELDLSKGASTAAAVLGGAALGATVLSEAPK